MRSSRSVWMCPRVRELRKRTQWSWQRLGQMFNRHRESLYRSARAEDMKELKEIAKHVVKFADGTYLGMPIRYECRVVSQRLAHRWLTWASAKMIADGAPFAGKGARAVRLVQR